MLHTQHGKCALLTDGPPMSSSTQTRTAMTQATRSARAAANYIPTDAHVADKLRRQRHKCSPWEELQYTVGKQWPTLRQQTLMPRHIYTISFANGNAIVAQLPVTHGNPCMATEKNTSPGADPILTGP